MGYSPTQGRWLEQDPEGYLDGMNHYQAFSSNPINKVDPLGLYTLNWGSGFTLADRNMILGSIGNVKTRVGGIITEIDAELAKEKCKPIIEHLNHLRTIMTGITDDLDPGMWQGDTFHITLNNFNPDAPLRWIKGIGTSIEFNTAAKTPWNKVPDLDLTLFHELTHEQGTDDGEAGDDWNNAHAIARLMDTPVANWTPLRIARLKGFCPCSPAAKSPPKTKPPTTQP